MTPPKGNSKGVDTTTKAAGKLPPGVQKLATVAGIAVGGKLPPGCRYIGIKARAYQSLLIAALEASGREVDIAALSFANTAAQFHRHAKFCERVLAESEDLTPGEKLAYSREIAKAAAERDRNVRCMGLAVPPPTDDDPWTIEADYEPVALPMPGDDEAGEQDEAGDDASEQAAADGFSIEPAAAADADAADNDTAAADEPHTGSEG